MDCLKPLRTAAVHLPAIKNLTYSTVLILLFSIIATTRVPPPSLVPHPKYQFRPIPAGWSARPPSASSSHSHPASSVTDQVVIDVGSEESSSPVFSWPSSPNNPVDVVRIDGVNLDTHAFIDANGRTRLFRGVNVVYKVHPWHPLTDVWHPQFSFSREDIELLADLNINAIRLGIQWPGVEPVRGQYNQTYLDVVKSIIRRCEEKGIYILVDFHQDSLSEKFCGEGLPLWAVEVSERSAFPLPLETKSWTTDERGIPLREDCLKHNWPTYQTTVAGSQAYQNLYDDKDGIRTAFGQFWQTVATELKEFRNILGYDLINEPFAGAIYRNPALLVPGAADRINLQPFYNSISEAIRQVDQQSIIFFESVTWDNLVVGFSDTPGGQQYKNRTALSYHHYYPLPNIARLEPTIKDRLKDVSRLKTGMMLTEFDIAYENQGREHVRDLVEALDVADKYFQSWTGWEFKPFYPMTGFGDSLIDPVTGEIRWPMVQVYSRTYAHAVAGKLINHKFDMETGKFDLKYEITNVAATTEIRIMKRVHYPNGYAVRISPASKARWSPRSDNYNLIEIRHMSRAQVGDIIEVVIIALQL
ncbi:hypothetical protein SeMB42_g00399 [Synchytrium endobioticum]|uniref:Glycoside hydrolase family 5 domain-containing protein n=1 Tax=Synchytrium endobioticum TaxID=286115 RepID=A0A507DRL9_9FUNG|nr:hypothetical protein SeLEV6574_g02551 [Synchytrium endobioticum]TPX54186.1 hypothetical protein SeMB42_g00399 [Synchytrium endobioticum]